MTEETFRKMASIQRIEEVKSIPEADRICAYRVSGWWIVDQVGKYQVGDLVVYCEIDSFLPTTVAPFLTKPGKFPKEYLGVSGERLKTVRLRRQISQGLLLPLPVLIFDYDVVPGEICVTSEFIPDSSSGICIIDQKDGLLGLDVSSVLGIQKWEPPPEFTAANARGNFPSWGKRTDQERVQNLRREVKEWYDVDALWEVTEKIDGCLHEDSLISTKLGQKKIKDIKVGEEIYSYNNDSGEMELDSVVGVLVREESKNWFELELENGVTIKITGNHRVWIPALKCYREVQYLDGTEELLELTEK